MHDARTLLAADAAQIVDVMEQRVHQRAAGVAGGGMHDHARRLVHDDEVGILIDDGERQRLGGRRRVHRFENLDGDLLSGFHRLIGLGLAARRPGPGRP